MATIWEKLENTSLEEKAVIANFCNEKIDEINASLKGSTVTQKIALLEEKRDYEQEADFLGSIFENFERSVIDQVLKEKPSLDAAYKHLEEFLDFNFDSDGEDDEEEEKHAAAASH